MSLSVVAEFTARIDLGAVAVVGMTPQGLRRVVPILGGTFEGTSLRGSVLAGGADWQYERADGALVVSARYLLKTDDGVLIQIDNNGIRHAAPAIMKRLAEGDAVDPKDYYFRTRPEFSAPAGRYDWLNTHVFIATAEREAARVLLEVYRVL